MISFFLPIFILSDNALYLSHAFIDTLDTTKCNELQSKYIYRHENPEIYCQNPENEFNNEYDECVTYYKSVKNFYCSSKTEVSSYFAKLSKDIDALYIINNNEELTLDFSQLTQQLKVVIYNDDSIESMNTNIAEIDSKILNILHQNTNPIKNENHIISKSSLPIINFDGNIKEKVSYMIVYKASVKITNNELNIHSLFLLKSSICTDSKMIKTNHLIIDDTSRNYIQNVEQNLIKVDQLCINFNIDTSNSRYDNFEIVFLDDAWYFYKRSYNYKYNSSIFYEGGHPYINYSIANTLGFISNTYTIILNNEKNIQGKHSLNFTYDRDIYYPLKIQKPIKRSNKYQSPRYGLSFENFTKNLINNPDIKINVMIDTKRFFLFPQDETKWINVQEKYLYEPKKSIPMHNSYDKVKRVPRQTFIFVDTENEKCSDAKKFFVEKECSTDPYIDDDRFEGGSMECQQFFSSTEDVLCAHISNVNEILADVSERTENIYIYNYAGDLELDFNNLKNQSKVVIFNEKNDPNAASYISKMIKTFEDTIINNKKIPLSTGNNDLRSISINGDIKEKVSYLIVSNAKLTVTTSDLNIHTLCLINSFITSTSRNIKTNHLVCDFASYSDVENNELVQNLIHVDQFGLILSSELNYDYIISYETDCWDISANKLVQENYQKFTAIPYSIAESFAFITVTSYVDIHLEDKSLTSLKDLNLTVLSFNPVKMPNASILTLLENEQKYSVKIETSGDWSKIQKNLNFTIVTDEESFEIIKPNNAKIDFTIDPVFIYQTSNKKRPPSEYLPKYAVILATTNSTYAKEINDYYDLWLNYDDIKCMNEDCYNKFEAVSGFYISNGLDMNDQLSKISSDTEFIYIYSIYLGNEINADFNKLKSQVVVIFSDGTKTLENFYASTDSRIHADTLNFASKIMTANISKKVTANVKAKINIVGNIKYKVSYISIANGQLTITNNDLDIHTLLLIQSSLNSNSKKIKTFTFIADTYICPQFSGSDLIEVKHFGVFNPTEQERLNITYTNSAWEVVAYSSNENFKPKPKYTISYSKCEMLEYLGDIFTLDLMADKSVKQAKTINVTLFDFSYRKYESPIVYPQFPTYTYAKMLGLRSPFYIDKYGDWSGIKGYPKIIITTVYGDSSERLEGIAIYNHKRYIYKQTEETVNMNHDNQKYSYIFAGDIPKFYNLILENRYIYNEGFCNTKEGYTYFGGTEMCIEFFYSLESFIAVKEKKRYSVDINDIDEQLSQVSPNTDHLYIIRTIPIRHFLDFQIDFSKLKSQMKVTVVDSYLLTYSKSTIWDEVDGEHPIDLYLKILQGMFQAEKNKKDDVPDTYDRALEQIRIVGDTGDKVSHLIIGAFNLQVINSDLKVDTLTLAQSTIDKDTKIIEVNNLLADYASTKVIFSPKFIKILDHVKTNQFTYYTSYDYNIKKNELGYRIVFDEDSIKYQMIYEENNTESLLDLSSIPSSFAKIFAIIPQSDLIKLFSSGLNVKKVNDFNLTIRRYDPFNFSYMIDQPYKRGNWPDTYESLQIEQDGDWSGVTNSPKFYITYDNEETSVEFPETFTNFEVLPEGFYNYTSKSDQLLDNNGFDDIDIPEQSTETVDISDKNNDEIQGIINDKLSNGFNDVTNENKDKVVIINQPVKDFVSNEKYNDNEWIQFSSGSTIILKGENLNIVLPDQGDITIEAEDTDNINLKIKGKGTLNLQSTDKSKTSFKVKGKSTIFDGETSIIVPEGSTASFEQIDLAKGGTINVKDTNGGSVPLNVEKIRVQSKSTTTLNNAKITEKISIPQTSSIDLEDVDVDGAIIEYILISYEINTNMPLITGSLGAAPKKISINTTNASGEPNDGDNFIVAKARFNCDAWLNTLEIKGSKFTQKLCQDNDFAYILDEPSLKCLIMNIPGKPVEKDPGDGDDDNFKKILKIVIIVSIILVVIIIGSIVACCCCCCYKGCAKSKSKSKTKSKTKSKGRKHHDNSEDENDEIDITDDKIDNTDDQTDNTDDENQVEVNI